MSEDNQDERRARNIASTVMDIIAPHVDGMIAARREALLESMPSFDERTAYVPISESIERLMRAWEMSPQTSDGVSDEIYDAIGRLARMIAPVVRG